MDLEEGWDLDKPEDVEKSMDFVGEDKPVLLTGSLPCEAFSQLRHSRESKRDPAEVAQQRAMGEGDPKLLAERNVSSLMKGGSSIVSTLMMLMMPTLMGNSKNLRDYPKSLKSKAPCAAGRWKQWADEENLAASEATYRR